MQKYVESLVEPFAARIRAGDVTLREYIERILLEYRQQMEKALLDADRIERERISGAIAKFEERWHRIEEQIVSGVAVAVEAVAQLRRERELVTGAQSEAIRKAEEAVKLAIDKAEVATDRRFEQATAARTSISDRLNTMMPREVAEAQFAELRRSIAELTEKISKIT
jgi:hypothetical protein